jgi:signal transduction histidine kinase
MSNRRNRVKAIALGAVLFFAVMQAYALYKLFDLQTEISTDVGENMVWAITQAVYQSGQLSVAANTKPATDASQQSMALHLDLLRANLHMLEQGPQQRYMRRSGVHEDLQRIQAELQTPDVDYATLPARLRQAGNSVMLAEREDAGKRRDAHRILIIQVMATVIGILLAGALLCWQLMSSLKRAERAKAEVVQQHMQTRSLLDALQQERSTRMRYRDFVSLMSHQLRTPLAVIDSTAQRLKRQLSEPLLEQNVLERSQRIRTSVNHLNHLIGRVLEGLRLEEGLNGGESSANLDRQRRDWLSVCDAALERFGDLLSERDIQLNPPSGSAPLWVDCDHTWCVEILCNLLSNAHKYSPPEQPIELTTWIEQDKLCCSVRDFGSGINEEDMALIFERFYRSATTQHVAGIGLGLPIAHTLTQWHDGSLSVANAPGGGAIFTLSLPLQASSRG